MAHISDYLTKEQIREFTRPSDWEGAKSVAISWAIIAAAFGLVAWRSNVFTMTIALVLLGGRQLALAILMHEASHRTLFASRGLNDVIGKWFCAAPVWQHLEDYRTHHLAHHAHTGTERDTDISLVANLPTTRSGMIRKFARDLSGITGLKRVVGLLAMDFGYVGYTAASDVRKIDQSDKATSAILRHGLQRIVPVLLTNVVLFGLLAFTGHAGLYGLWVVAYLTTFSLFIRVRSMAEHAVIPQSVEAHVSTGEASGTPAGNERVDQFAVTRTTHANWLARLTVAPHFVNYHVEHHVLPTVPHYQLPRLHALLSAKGAFDRSHYANTYWQTVRAAAQGQ